MTGLVRLKKTSQTWEELVSNSLETNILKTTFRKSERQEEGIILMTLIFQEGDCNTFLRKIVLCKGILRNPY